MKKTILLIAAMFAGNAMAAMPCQWQSNYGYVKFIAPYNTWNSVRFGLTGGQTLGAIYGTYNMPVPTDPVKLELFKQQMDLLKSAQERGVMISVETTGEACSKAVSLPSVSFVTSQVWWK